MGEGPRRLLSLCASWVFVIENFAECGEPGSANGALGSGRGLRAGESDLRGFFVFLGERISRSGVR